MSDSNMLKVVRAQVVFLAMLLFATGAQAAWWEFGARDDEPVIDELKFNSIDVLDADDEVVLTRSDLDNNRLVVRGRGTVRDGAIGLIELTFDGGDTWTPVELDERGSFVFEFVPELNRRYNFAVRAFTTTGKATNDEDNQFVLEVIPKFDTDEVLKVFREMLEAYMRENRSGVINRVSEDFEGDRVALEDAVDDDLRWLDNIRIQINVSRVMRYDGDFQIYFTFRRQAMSVASGQLLSDAAATSVSFRREEGSYRLSRMAAPPIFGVSQPGVATSVTEQSVGQDVLTLNPDSGEATTTPQGDTADDDFSSVESGTVTLNFFSFTNAQGFVFDGASVETETDQGNITGDVAFFGSELTLQNGVLVQLISGSLDTVSEAPASGYNAQPAIFNLVPGSLFALQLLGPQFALIEIVSINFGNTVTFRYKYQPNGSRNF